MSEEEEKLATFLAVTGIPDRDRDQARQLLEENNWDLDVRVCLIIFDSFNKSYFLSRER
jgi:hypothetical protein